MKCFNVNCITDRGEVITVGVMTTDEEHARECAVKSLLEGRHIIASPVSVKEVDAI